MRNLKCIHFVAFLLIMIPVFQSCKKKEAPTLSTSDVINITGSTATSGGTITDEGSGTVIERGICWSKSITPTIASERSIEGGGAGTFISNITNLEAATTYYVRAYAKNSDGVGYGMTMSFVTLGSKALVTTPSATDLTGLTAKLTGSVNPNYLSTTVVFEYGTSTSYGNEIVATQSPIVGSVPITINASIAGLLPQTTYYFRIKATNQFGAVYSEGSSFKYSIVDRDGNAYNATLIGTQIWIEPNLMSTKLNDGTPIQLVTSNSEWMNKTTASYSWYDNQQTNRDIYGGLYNWYAVSTGKLCPTGWHVPSESEWTTLINYLGTNNIGGKLKETGLSHWITPNSGATNETNFKALPGGFRDVYSGGIFRDAGYYGFWWSATENDIEMAKYHGLYYNSTDVLTNSFSKATGFSVRCIKD